MSTTYARADHVEAVEMDGDLVMMGMDQGAYVALRDVAASIWNHLAVPRTIDDLTFAIPRTRYLTSRKHNQGATSGKPASRLAQPTGVFGRRDSKRVDGDHVRAQVGKAHQQLIGQELDVTTSSPRHRSPF